MKNLKNGRPRRKSRKSPGLIPFQIHPSHLQLFQIRKNKRGKRIRRNDEWTTQRLPKLVFCGEKYNAVLVKTKRLLINDMLQFKNHIFK